MREGAVVKHYLNGHAIAHPTEVFDPEDLLVMTAAFEHAWQNLQNSGVQFESDRQSQQARSAIAKHIIEQARQGERDERRLREGALLEYTKSNLRNAPRK
jgi:hypothetical protein